MAAAVAMATGSDVQPLALARRSCSVESCGSLCVTAWLEPTGSIGKRLTDRKQHLGTLKITAPLPLRCRRWPSLLFAAPSWLAAHHWQQRRRYRPRHLLRRLAPLAWLPMQRRASAASSSSQRRPACPPCSPDGVQTRPALLPACSAASSHLPAAATRVARGGWVRRLPRAQLPGETHRRQRSRSAGSDSTHTSGGVGGSRHGGDTRGRQRRP